ncbi:AEC family transporter [Aliiroseovarius sp. PTFE2010]|uniref:AEC family transporter n=1 Tax=Aliiroseovarius sp. PTFE2010 TaxID=3417190 RepID=UPI003CF7B593
MQALVDVILPVFLVIGFGYVAVWRRLFSDSAMDGVMLFAQNFAVPTLLFNAIAHLDLGQSFNLPLLTTFYGGAFAGYMFAWAGAKYLFARPPEDCVAIGFCGLFSNSLLLGIPITERAYGSEALAWNFAIISVHAPMIYAFGITMMEVTRSRGSGLPLGKLAAQIWRRIIHNPLVIGIALGFAVNLSGVRPPELFWSAIEMMNRAAIPAALFGLGGVLYRYKPEGDFKVIVWVVVASLAVHPAVAWVIGGPLWGLDTGPQRSAVLTAAMAPGVNSYLFANMYGRANRVAASGVLVGTGLSILTIWGWLLILP